MDSKIIEHTQKTIYPRRKLGVQLSVEKLSYQNNKLFLYVGQNNLKYITLEEAEDIAIAAEGWASDIRKLVEDFKKSKQDH